MTMKRTVKTLTWIILIAGAVSFWDLFVARKNIKQLSPQAPKNISVPAQHEPIGPIETAALENSSANSPDLPPAPQDTSSNPNIPAKFLLPIPFYSQAPLSKWDAVHEEMCEEASMLNGGLYLLSENPSKEAFEKNLMDFKKIEEKELGNYKSNTVAEVKKAADIYFAGKVTSKIINNPTIEDIEAEISAGNPVIVPLAGRDIGNPNFTPPGPVYHMLVVKGYDSQNFITNDVGTRKGNSYVYAKDVIMQDMHDWNAKDIHLGAKKVLVLYK